MSIFNLEEQNSSLDNKIVAGLERLSQVFRILLWEKANKHKLSPIQIQLLIFIQYHSFEKTTISYLAKEFNLTKPTISDAIKVLEQKKLIKKNTSSLDTRSYSVQLTAAGKKIANDSESFIEPLKDLIADIKESDKIILWQQVSGIIIQLNKMNVISIQRTCINCKHYTVKNKQPYCTLLNEKLNYENIRIDCEDFALAH